MVDIEVWTLCKLEMHDCKQESIPVSCSQSLVFVPTNNPTSLLTQSLLQYVGVKSLSATSIDSDELELY